MLKAPPKFVTNIGAWEYTLAKLANLQEDDGKPRVDEYGNPLSYGAAIAIYKHVVKKYPAFQTATHGPNAIPEYRNVGLNLADLAEAYPVGAMFWFDDVLCEAVPYMGGMAIYPDAVGKLFVRGKILDVDPLGKHKDWPIGKVNGFPPHRCADFVSGAER